ncbi:uncharacterized protein LOC141648916 [Silene latifolia]|uniref:uncharacterized protein LOC141648916 n=1 Tax=Silene latifolia TaxID=37657 RepID=UPI003D781DBA
MERGSRSKGKGVLGESSNGGREVFVWEANEDVGNEGQVEKILVGKIWASKTINSKAAIDTMLRLWNPTGKVMGNVLDARERTFIFRFEDDRDKVRVMEGQPWHFDKFVWCFNEPSGEGKLSDTILDRLPIWARVYDLPIKGRTNEANLRRLGEQLGTYVVRDDSPYPELEKAVRIQVLHNIRKPLQPSVEIRLADGKINFFDVKYERLPLYCYGCGVLGHGLKDCDSGPHDEDNLLYGEKLRASPRKGGKAGVAEERKTSRDLRPEFEEEYRRSEEEMIEKLKRIALSSKAKFQKGVGGVELQSVLEESTQGGLGSGVVGGIGSLGWDGGKNTGEQAVVDMSDGVRGGKMVELVEHSTLYTGNPGEVSAEEIVVEAGRVEMVAKGEASVRKWQRTERVEHGGVSFSSVIADNEVINENHKRTRVEDGGEAAGASKRVACHRDVGLGNPSAVGGLRNLVRREAPALVFLCETKLSSEEMRSVMLRFEDYSGMAVDSVGRSGGLAFLWRKDVNVVFRSASVHFMDFDIRTDDLEWRCTGFYGWPTVQDRHLSWELLRSLAAESRSPWLCVGDFNEILYANEMKGGNRAQRQMNSFRDAVDVCELRDLGFEGYEFTFDNGQAGVDNRQCRLDRAFNNEGWRDLFPYAKVINMNREWSDHSPIKVFLDGRERLDGPRGRNFRFEQIWVGEEGCEDTIKKAWEEDDWNVVDTIARCARELQKWKGVSIGKIMRDLSRKRRRLKWLNVNERTVANVRERKAVIKDINSLLRQEEVFWRQRSRALWLKEGDRNTKYFHRKAGQQKKKNRIGRIVVEGDRAVTGNEGIKGAAVDFFSTLFTSSQPAVFDELLIGVKNRVTLDMNESFKAEYKGDEVFEALQQMHPLKAPGPDGMNALFYQTYWHIVGPSVTRLVLRILNGSESPGIINSTHIVLIPKKKAPDKFSDYRPISLCNVLYKLVAKVLANRLKRFLGCLVSENQSAFTPGRLISDNILIVFEMFHYMKNARSKEGHMALKLDMAKAYDRVEWVFLEKVLLTMGFDGSWVGNVMRCVRTVSYDVLINGSPSATFVPTRGLRQGDPLSPYLFILCAEVLSSMIRRKVEEGVLHGIRVAPLSPVVSHLFFADDSIIFVKANETQARIVMELLSQYEIASGQLVSKEKTTVSFSKGTSVWRRDKVVSVLGVQAVQEQGKYLGLPTVIGHSKQVLNKVVRDKLNNKMQGWRGKLFSRAGRETLIKAVAQSIPTYAMSVFKLPANFCDELRSIVSRFWWGSENGKRKISWVSWEAMCRVKARGGMGFRDFGNFNLALLAKQAWRLICNEESLMVGVLKGKYFPNCSFMEAVIGNNSSYTWRSICEAKKVMGLGIRRRVGDGKGTRVWLDPWIPGTSSRCVISPRGGFDLETKVAELMVVGEARWNREKVEAMFLPFEAERIMNIRLSELVQEDSWCWDGARDGEYSVKEGYRLLAAEEEEEEEQSDTSMASWIWKAIWSAPVIPRIKVFMWQLCSDALPVRGNIATRIQNFDCFCPRCHAGEESCVHVFRDCGWNEEVWEMVGLEVFRSHSNMRIREWVEVELRRMGMEERVLFMTTCWVIWEQRNKLLFDNGLWTGERVVRRIMDVVWEMESLKEDEAVMERGRGDSTAVGRWGKPSEGLWKVNVDAGVKEGMGVGLGAVCRDGDGRVAWAVAVQTAGTCCVQMAEAEAILLGLKEARCVGMRSVVIESDCLNVVNALKERKRGRSDIFLIYDEILMLVPLFDTVIFSYTRRDCNKLAHLVAHATPWTIGRRFWLDVLPPSLVGVAEQDLFDI